MTRAVDAQDRGSHGGWWLLLKSAFPFILCWGTNHKRETQDSQCSFKTTLNTD